MNLELAHRRYTEQAAWTLQAQRRLLAQAGLANAKRVLEVGCGTGAILRNVNIAPDGELFGIDIDREALHMARQVAPAATLLAGDAHSLPFSAGSFDIAFCHFVVLWLRQPALALAEMRRVVRPGGAVIAIAEPEYSGRIDKPAELEALGKGQTAALIAQGADPAIGGKLEQLFKQAGLQLIDAGMLSSEGESTDSDLEHEVLQADLRDKAELEHLLRLDAAAWKAGTRVLQVPTFYALARV